MSIGQTYPALPVELLDIKLKIQATAKGPPLTVQHNIILDQILKVDSLIFTPNSSLTFAKLDVPWIIIYADIIDTNGSASIVRTNSINLDGKPGQAGVRASAAPNFPGASGFAGGPGGPGEQGRSQPIPEIFVFCQQMTSGGNPIGQVSDVTLTMNFDGYPGGRGGDGGNGGNGSDGRVGSDAENNWLGFCGKGPGWGGRGGDAGFGGAPGVGGNGTDGALIYFFTQPLQSNYFDAITSSVKGGRRGSNGRPGHNGSPGLGGAEGSIIQTGCGVAGRDGPPGQILRACGIPDVSGHDGSNSPEHVVYGYTNFSELNTV